MSTIVTRAAKGSPLTHNEVDANFTNLNTDKYQSGDTVTFAAAVVTGSATINGTSIPNNKTLVVTTDIGSTVQGYDADLAAFAAKTAPTGDVVGTSDSQTLTNKTIALGNNTVSGTLSQFNTAVTDADLVSIAGSETLTNKTLTSPTVNTATISGGTINNATVGATTAASGKFTTLEATGFNAASYFGFKNRIINGAMVIDQRNAGASVTPINQQYLVDRWLAGLTQASKFTAQQSSVAPDGFSNSLLITSSSAYSVGSGDTFFIQQRIEGFNSADLMYGTATAKTTTLSFWVRSSLTGTFGGNYTNSGTTRAYPFSYTISAANIWEYKTVTVVGDTTGTWVGGTNGQGLTVTFSLGTGSTLSNTAGAWAAGNFLSATGATSVVGTSGATFYITGVQLEVGSTATSFDYRPYGTELALCQRYCFNRFADGSINDYAPLGQGRYYGTNVAQLYVPFPVTMRTSPSSITVSGTILVNDTTFSGANWTSPVLNETSCDGATVTGSTTTGTTAGNATTFYANSTSVVSIIFNAEL